MNYRELGKTGVMVSEIGMGMWEYRGGPEMMRKGIDLGATFIEIGRAHV